MNYGVSPTGIKQVLCGRRAEVQSNAEALGRFSPVTAFLFHSGRGHESRSTYAWSRDFSLRSHGFCQGTGGPRTSPGGPAAPMGPWPSRTLRKCTDSHGLLHRSRQRHFLFHFPPCDSTGTSERAGVSKGRALRGPGGRAFPVLFRGAQRTWVFTETGS